MKTIKDILGLAEPDPVKDFFFKAYQGKGIKAEMETFLRWTDPASMLKELLGPEATRKLVELRLSWGGTVQQCLQESIEFMPAKETWFQIIAKAEAFKKHLADLEGQNPGAVGLVKEFEDYRTAAKIPAVVGKITTGGN